jgi:uncharacterized protein YbjT (DUF2867 family)
MSGYTKFAIVGVGRIGNCILQELLKEMAAGIVEEVVVLTREGSNKTIQGDAKVMEVDYSNDASIKHALTGVDVVISTVPVAVVGVQVRIAAAAKDAGVQLFVPSEFGGKWEARIEGMFATKANIRDQLKALDVPIAAFYTGLWADCPWVPNVDLDVTGGKVSVGGDGNKRITLTSRPDVARYVSYVLTRLPPEQLKNREFFVAGDNKSFNEIFKAYEEKSGRKLQVTYIPVSELDARLAANPKDVIAYLHKFWATAGPFHQPDDYLYPDWNPSPMIDNIPVA